MSMMPELLVTLMRRTISVSLVSALMCVAIAAIPVALPVAMLIDRLSQGKLESARSYLFITSYLVLEFLAVIAAVTYGLAYPFLGASTAARSERSERLHVSLQSWWTRSLLASARWLFRLRMEVTGSELVAQGPMLLLMRHSSIGDTVIPSMLVTQAHGIRLRYVLKKELLWDPALDFVGHRIPNYFVDRNAKNPRAEIDGVRALTAGLRENEGVIIYPEGTVYDAGRRAKAVARVAAKGDEMITSRARALRHVLPPRVGGTLALLESNPGLDVVFCAHVGFEGAVDFRALMTARWLDSVIRVRFLRVPYADVPREPSELTEFIWSSWERMDREVGALHALSALEALNSGAPCLETDASSRSQRHHAG